MTAEDTLFVGKAASDVAIVLKNNDGDLYRLETSDEGVYVTKNGHGTSFLTGFPARRKVTQKAASYTCTADDSGTLFSAITGAVTFTLPAASGNAGIWYEFFNAVDNDMTVSGTAGELITKNDVAANSIAFSTSTEKIGGSIKATCDGTSWLIQTFGNETFTTMTVTT